MSDPAEIRAEGRRLREALWWTEPDSEEGRTATALWSEWLEEHADVLLADPAPVGLTEKQITAIRLARKALLLGDEIDMDERWFVLGSIDGAFPLIEASVPVSPSVDPEEEP